jgi:hypothetical protein
MLFHSIAATSTGSLKAVLTVGFLIGLLSLSIRFLDEKLDQSTKDRINAWVRGLEPDLAPVSLSRVFVSGGNYWTSVLLIGYVGCVLILIPVGILFSSWSKWDSPVVFTILCFASPISALAPIQVFGAPTPYHSFRRLSILVALSIVCFPAFARLTVLDQSRHYLGAETIEAFVMLPVYAFLMVACALLAAGLAFVFSCGVIIGLNYLVLIVAYPAVRWLARHPKGAWSAFVFAVTMLLGFLRLFI